MLFRALFTKRKPRSFGFTPFYYQEKVDQETDEHSPRIKFRRIRTNVTVGKRSVTSMVVLAVLLLAMLIYFWNLVNRDFSTSELENIRIEEIPSDY